MGVDTDRLLLTNGGAEAIALVATELGGRVAEPEFALHPRGGSALAVEPSQSDRAAGRRRRQAEIWDEAFFPLATGAVDPGRSGAVVVGSLTKLLACPGLRLGYVLAEPPHSSTTAGAGNRRGR